MERLVRKDVFLDFLSPDNNGIYGTYANYIGNKPRHIELLEEGLNVAVFLCGEKCLLPPFFLLQCEVARAALSRKADYLTEGIIRFPLREASLGDFFEKKAAEYQTVRDSYSGLYAPSGQRFIERYSEAVLKRSARVGSSIASRWEAGPDDSQLWVPVLKLLPSPTIENLRKIPQRLKNDGESVTWAGMQKHLPEVAKLAEFELNQALQHEYTSVYLDEYNATIISRLPPKTTDLLLASADLSYDYVCWRGVLRALRLWPTFVKMHAGDVISLLYRHGYLSFLRTFHAVCYACATTTEVIQIFAGAVFSRSKLLAPFVRRQLTKIDQIVRAQSILTEAQLNALDWYLHVVSEAVQSIGLIQITPPHETREESKGVNVPTPTVFLVHGHDHVTRDKINLFLRDKGLNVKVMEDEAWGGKTVPEKFEGLASGSNYVIVIATPDDSLTDKKTGKELTRLRQNVVLEIGYFWGAFGRAGRFSLLLKEDPALELPTDISGLGYIAITDDLGATKLRLEKELVAAGLLPASRRGARS